MSEEPASETGTVEQDSWLPHTKYFYTRLRDGTHHTTIVYGDEGWPKDFFAEEEAKYGKIKVTSSTVLDRNYDTRHYLF